MIVSGWQQALTLVAVLIPGFVFQGVQRGRIGPSPEDRELTARLIRALAFSVGFVLVYLLILGHSLIDRLLSPQDNLGDPRLVAAMGLLLVFLLPAICGHLTASFLTRQAYNGTTFWRTFFEKAPPNDGKSLTWMRAVFSRESNYNPIPTAWDFATAGVDEGSFIRVLNANGLWIGGRVTSAAYFTGYPEPRDVFIDQAWQMGEEGTFLAPMESPTGMWVPCSDAQLVQFVAPPE